MAIYTADYIAALQALIVAINKNDNGFVDHLPELRRMMSLDRVPQQIIDAYSHLVRVTFT